MEDTPSIRVLVKSVEMNSITYSICLNLLFGVHQYCTFYLMPILQLRRSILVGIINALTMSSPHDKISYLIGLLH
jgi:hypothetical protein